MTKKKSILDEIRRNALNPSNNERYKFRIVVFTTIIILGLLYTVITEKIFTYENLFIFIIVIFSTTFAIYYYKKLKKK